MAAKRPHKEVVSSPFEPPPLSLARLRRATASSASHEASQPSGNGVAASPSKLARKQRRVEEKQAAERAQGAMPCLPIPSDFVQVF